MPNPEQEARKTIDRLLTQAGWKVCDPNQNNYILYYKPIIPMVLIEAKDDVDGCTNATGRTPKCRKGQDGRARPASAGCARVANNW